MLKQRLLTAAILIPLIVSAILMLPTYAVAVILALVVLLAALEWLIVIGIKSRMAQLISLAAIALLTWAVAQVPNEVVILQVSCAVWSIASILIVMFAHISLTPWLKNLFISRWFGVVVMILVLVPFYHAALLLHQYALLGPQLLLYLLVTVWLADTGGYFAGKRWGSHKLAKAISPNKTWEGVYGALVLTSICAIIAYVAGLNGTMTFANWYGLTILVTLSSIVGDLFESLFKRAHGVKDSGHLLPGHGGMLDRVDSLLSALPVFVSGLLIAGAI